MLNPCSFCTALCCKDYLITVTSFDVLRIIENTGKKPEEFATLARASILNPDDSMILECYDKNGRSEHLLALCSHPCYFLDKKNRCTIHEFAPFGCRRYPIDPKNEVFERASCPLPSNLLFRFKHAGVSLDEYMKQINNYREIVKGWNKMHGGKKDCMRFLLDKSKFIH